MANKVYRFALIQPAIDANQLASEVGFPITVMMTSSGGLTIDITTDESFKDDLIDVMSIRGFSLLEEDPSTTTENSFIQGFNNTLFNSSVLDDAGSIVYTGNGKIVTLT